MEGQNKRGKVSKLALTVRTSTSGGSRTTGAFAASKGLVPPVLQEVGKLAAGVAAVATGSSTGNPRNKHALQPGHSLMDWIRLGSSGKDLTGVGPQAGHLTVTTRQLAEHNKENDAWIAIRGRVYNVTHYLAFHPGGPEELMRGVGKDATTLFDQVHSWVNYESLLQKCFIGNLVAVDPSIDTSTLFVTNSSNATPDSKVKIPSSKTTSPKILLPNKVTPLQDYKIEKSSTGNNNTETISNSTPPPPTLYPIPRFDWIQKTDYITIIFYTKPFSNPQIEITSPDDNNCLTIFIEYYHQLFSNSLKFYKAVQWPCQIKMNYETGKIEVQFRKDIGNIWENFGTLDQKSDEKSISTDEIKFKYTVVNKSEINYNTSLLELKRLDEAKLVVPIGKHVRVFYNIQGEETARSYTPVPISLFSKFKPQTYLTDNVCLLVKSYSQGCVSKYICGRKKGDVLEISKPLGSFDLNNVNSRENFILLAAGTGITPMLSLVILLLERRMRKCQTLTLLFFNRTEEDILLRSQFETLQHEDNRFKVKHILSQADPKWNGLRGQLSKENLSTLIQEHLENSIYKQSDIFFFICGPTPFTTLANSLLLDLGFEKEQYHLFLG